MRTLTLKKFGEICDDVPKHKFVLVQVVPSWLGYPEVKCEHPFNPLHHKQRQFVLGSKV